jgi:hypothetical protein
LECSSAQETRDFQQSRAVINHCIRHEHIMMSLALSDVSIKKYITKAPHMGIIVVYVVVFTQYMVGNKRISSFMWNGVMNALTVHDGLKVHRIRREKLNLSES